MFYNLSVCIKVWHTKGSKTVKTKSESTVKECLEVEWVLTVVTNDTLRAYWVIKCILITHALCNNSKFRSILQLTFMLSNQN